MKKRPNNTDNATLLKVISEQQQTIKSLHQELEQLQHKLDKLLHPLYGTKSEKKSTSPTDSSPPVVNRVVPAQEKKETNSNTLNLDGRRPLPSDLPRVRVEHDVPENKRNCPCCPLKMQRMGKVITEQLEYKPGELYVIEHVRIKYGCQRCKQDIITAPPAY
jgi:transposase